MLVKPHTAESEDKLNISVFFPDNMAGMAEDEDHRYLYA